MEKDQEGKKKHRCKVCRKCFPSGRSLGGHMRSHVTVSSSSSVNGDGLREKQKRAWRLSDSSTGEGKSFPSCQELFGHMSCHSDKDLDLAVTLMMLSRDTGSNWDLDLDLERSKDEIFVSEIHEGLRKIGAFDVNGKKRFYECSTCKKRFHSYQALGGHRASHKRLRMEAIAIDGTVMPELLLDLNMPAVVAAGDSNLKPSSSWWKCEPMLGLI